MTLIFICVYIHTCIHAYIHTHIRTYKRTYIPTCLFVSLHQKIVYVYMHINTYSRNVCVYKHIYICLQKSCALSIREAAWRWNFQVVISQSVQSGSAACTYFSLKNATETPCTWTTPLVELADGDKHTGRKW